MSRGPAGWVHVAEPVPTSPAVAEAPAPLQAPCPWPPLLCLFQTMPTPPSAPGSPRKTSSASRPQPQLCKRESCPRHAPRTPWPGLLGPGATWAPPPQPLCLFLSSPLPVCGVTLKAGGPAALHGSPHLRPEATPALYGFYCLFICPVHSRLGQPPVDTALLGPCHRALPTRLYLTTPQTAACWGSVCPTRDSVGLWGVPFCACDSALCPGLFPGAPLAVLCSTQAPCPVPGSGATIPSGPRAGRPQHLVAWPTGCSTAQCLGRD